MCHVVADGHNSDRSSSSDEDYVATRSAGKAPTPRQGGGRKEKCESHERDSHVYAREGGIPANGISHSPGRQVSSAPELPDPRRIQSCERKDAVHEVQVSAVIWDSRWINEPEIKPDEVKESDVMSVGQQLVALVGPSKAADVLEEARRGDRRKHGAE